MAAWASPWSLNAQYFMQRSPAGVFHSIEEHGQIHRPLVQRVVVCEERVHCSYSSTWAWDLDVRTAHVGIWLRKVVPKQQATQLLRTNPATCSTFHAAVVSALAAPQMSKQIIKAGAEVSLHRLLQQLEEPPLLRFIHKPVVEHAQHLGCSHFLCCLNPEPVRKGFSETECTGWLEGTQTQATCHALNHAREVAQVEHIVALGRRGQELRHNSAVDVHGSSDDSVRQSLQYIKDSSWSLAAPAATARQTLHKTLANKTNKGANMHMLHRLLSPTHHNALGEGTTGQKPGLDTCEDMQQASLAGLRDGKS
eukprot:349632-Chlamydomonas_euryale.AAC.19